jgi:hypothetical protein
MFTGLSFSLGARTPRGGAGVRQRYQPDFGGQGGFTLPSGTHADGRRATDCISPGACLKTESVGIESAEMSQITQLQAQLAEALDALRSALAVREATLAEQPGESELRARIAALEAEKAELADELERLRVKRDKDVAALDDLIAQLKPLIAEV